MWGTSRPRTPAIKTDIMDIFGDVTVTKHMCLQARKALLGFVKVRKISQLLIGFTFNLE